jgi:hypothetical protein
MALEIPELQVARVAGLADRAADFGNLVEIAGIDGADRLHGRRMQHGRMRYPLRPILREPRLDLDRRERGLRVP